MNIEAVKLLLIIGGAILMVDGLASLIKFRNQFVFYQLVRWERTCFAWLLIIVGVYL